jgi:hypothetical protein
MKTRTTLTLDEDVAARLEHLREAGGAKMRDLVNVALRAGLEVLSGGQEETSGHYHIKPVDLGPRVTNLDDIGVALSLYESEDRQ